MGRIRPFIDRRDFFSNTPTLIIRRYYTHQFFKNKWFFLKVWFQNRRAKEKRLKKDAGRNGWNYFHGPGGRKFDLDDDEILDEDTSSEKRDFNRSGSKFRDILCLVMVGAWAHLLIPNCKVCS